MDVVCAVYEYHLHGPKRFLLLLGENLARRYGLDEGFLTFFFKCWDLKHPKFCYLITWYFRDTSSSRLKWRECREHNVRRNYSVKGCEQAGITIVVTESRVPPSVDTFQDIYMHNFLWGLFIVGIVDNWLEIIYVQTWTSLGTLWEPLYC